MSGTNCTHLCATKQLYVTVTQLGELRQLCPKTAHFCATVMYNCAHSCVTKQRCKNLFIIITNLYLINKFYKIRDMKWPIVLYPWLFNKTKKQL